MSAVAFYSRAARGLADYLAQELRLVPGSHYQILSASDEPRILSVHLVVNPKYLRRVVSMAEELSMAVGLAGDQRMRITRGSGGILTLELPKPRSTWFDISVGHLPPRAGLRASVGLDTTRKPATVNFGDPLTAHALVAGTTGSGKTNAQQLLVWSLVEHNSPDRVQILLVDVEKRGLQWSRFADLAHLAHPVVVDEEEAVKVFAWIIAELDQRREQGRAEPGLFLFVDEIQGLDGVTASMRRVVQIGREFGMHFVGATQHPTVEVIGDSAIKRNLGIRLVGRVDDANAAHVATGRRETGAEDLVGSGDFILIQPGEQRRLTVALLDDKDIARLPRVAEPRFLDLGDLDLDHVIDVAQAAPRADDLEPEHVAVALASGRGITWLASELAIGAKKATRVKEFADGIRVALEKLGAEVVGYAEG